MPSGMVGYRSPRLEQLGVPHWFTTRVGPGGAELVLDPLVETVAAALREAAGTIEAPRLVCLRQVHGRDVVRVDARALPEGSTGDCLVGDRPDRLLWVYAADCVPVLVASADGRQVAAIHAGWRGLVAGAIPAALEQLGAPAAVAAIGPCLSLERCEMGDEVVAAFEAAELSAAVHRDFGPRAHVDVRAAARLQLERAGVTSIDTSDRCTWRDESEFPSHRRDVTHGAKARAGRIAALIAPKG